jgi:glycosyltransferase involved in cell wall biosynthesis
MKFSIIIASSNRAHTLPRLFHSIFVQQNNYHDFEVVLVDDASTDETKKVVDEWNVKYNHMIKYFRQPTRMERVMAYKRGLEEAKGDYLFYVGSDDMVFPFFMPWMHEWIERMPDQKLFNYGWCTINRHNKRIVSTPGKRFDLEPYAHFDNGLVAAGSFCWHKSITEQIELPDALNCYEFADKSGIVHSSGKPYGGATMTLGNPWGDDYYMFYKLTRKNKSCHLGLFGVIVVIR